MVSELKRTNSERKEHQTDMTKGKPEHTVCTRPQMDWTEDAGLHQWFKDWREEVELLLDMVLSHIRNQETKLIYVSLWAGKKARTYLSTVSEDNKDSLKTMLDTLEDWTKPKSDEIAALHTSEL